MADVGGYLGLLLGQSIYGLYQILASFKDYKKDIKNCLELRPWLGWASKAIQFQASYKN